MRQTLLLTAFSVLLACCANIPRPDTNLCIANAPAQHRKCYNMIEDYDDNGNLLPNATAEYLSLRSINDINKNMTVDPTSLANLKAYIGKLRDEYRRNCQPPQ